MKTATIAVSLVLALGSRSAAQIAPPPAVTEESYGGEVRLGLLVQSLHRASVLDGGGSVSGSMTLAGLDLLARIGTIGVYARTVSGTSTAIGQGLDGHFQLREARLLIGEPAFSPEIGIVNRTTAVGDTKETLTMYHGGLRLQWEIGNSGVEVTINGGVYVAKVNADSEDKLKVVGSSAEATMLYQAPRRLPLYALAGWRYERFDDYSGAIKRSEENSGPFVGIGLRLGGRPGLK
jgi:hypothetical protein